MLRKAAVDHLRGLKYDPSAERHCSILPLGAIYWSDEIPDFKALSEMSEEVSDQVFRLMNIRLHIWDDKALSAEDQAFWDEALAQVPDCPMFQRLALSEEDREAQSDTERSALDVIEQLASSANEFRVNQDGSFSATYDLTKGERQPVWRRLFSWISGKWS